MSEGKAYVGSKISLISKAEIRYEGILYTIDPKEATVALAKVRSFGTEDRFTDKPIASRDDVYEYVIFRGRDIKDIKVCEPPQHHTLIGGGLPNDPAILEAYQGPESRKQSFSPTGSLQSSEYGVNLGGMLPSQTYPTYSNSRSGTPTQKRRSPTADQGVQVSGGSEAGVKRDTRRNQPQQQNPRPLQPLNQQRQPLGAMNNAQPKQQSNRGWIRRGPRGPRGGGNGGRGGFNKPKEQLKFDGEYDFEQANAEFQEMESKFAKAKIIDTIQNGTIEAPVPISTPAAPVVVEEKSVNDEPVPEPVADVEDDQVSTFYDKTKSFFDSISCEALERSKGKFQRTDWRQERKLNVETFGVTNSYMRRGGYRGRGFRGRGGYRGGRSRGRGNSGQGPNQGTRVYFSGFDSARLNNSQNRRTQGWGNQEA
uniref:DFDF domain-containing protein n=1 Tax=Strigamia maritima TaxID=126957 RepID=T1IJ30_STRMM